MKRVGIMGGTFDPIHNGHLLIAEQVRIQYFLDIVIFIPSGKPPHKNILDVSESIHRYNMVNLAIASNDNFFSSLIEIKRDGETFTIDTLKELKIKYPECELYFIMGFDAFININTWKEYYNLPKYANFIVVSRNQGRNKESEYIGKEFNNKVEYFNNMEIDISSTKVRDFLNKKISITYMVDNLVEKYIKKNNLYGVNL